MAIIRKLQKTEIPLLKNFPPEDWAMDLPALFAIHFDRPYLYPFAAEAENKIVGCGSAYHFGRTGWLGNIIVIPEYRNRGIGRSLTQKLMDCLKRLGCSVQILIATEMGESVYKSLGFNTTSTYTFYRRETPIRFQTDPYIRTAEPGDIAEIQNLDREITGEERSCFLEKYLSTALVYPGTDASGIRGFFLPDFSNGLIMAADNGAGLELMKCRMSTGRTAAVIPSANRAAKEFLISNGFTEHRTAPRMVFGKEIAWHPAKVYNRGSGYCG